MNRMNNKRILLSWFSPQSDLLTDAEGNPTINPNGSNFLFHTHFYESYERHILLIATDKAERPDIQIAAVHLCKAFPSHNIERRFVEIDDILDFNEILQCVQPLLLAHKEYAMDFFITPGTAAMRLAWFILYQSTGLPIRLIQTRHPNDTTDGKPERLFIELERSQQLSGVLIRANKHAAQRVPFDDAMSYCYTQSIIPIYHQAQRVAQANRGNVIIYGASGTGKEHLARFIHKHSPRHKKKFIAVNCSAFQDNLLESRLFGYAKGSFTGANTAYGGLFAEADGGTIFLDEIGDVSPYMQQSLLRVLQNQEITPLGGAPRRVDVRIVAATHRDLAKLCADEKFRWDLYYRLNVMELALPSLQERSADERLELIRFFLRRKQQEFGHAQPLELDGAAEHFLLQYPFHGNIRELENIIEACYVNCSQRVQVRDLPRRMWLTQPSIDTGQSLRLDDVERSHIQRVFQLHQQNLTQTAKALGIGLNTLKRKLKEG